jgi:hypothetical protein
MWNNKDKILEKVGELNSKQTTVSIRSKKLYDRMKGWSIQTIFLSTNPFHMGKYYDLIVGFPSFKARRKCVETYDVCRIILLCHKTFSSTVFKHTVPDIISTITVLK